MSDEDQAVGYCKPPKGSQWVMGQSGNLKGRPRNKPKPERALSSRQLTKDIVEVMQNPVTVRMPSGVTEKMPTIQALIAQTAQKALAGDRVTARFLFRLYMTELKRLEEDRATGILFLELDAYERREVRGGLPPDEFAMLERFRRHSREIR